jgi:hypothetical protein
VVVAVAEIAPPTTTEAAAIIPNLTITRPLVEDPPPIAPALEDADVDVEEEDVVETKAQQKITTGVDAWQLVLAGAVPLDD